MQQQAAAINGQLSFWCSFCGTNSDNNKSLQGYHSALDSAVAS